MTKNLLNKLNVLIKSSLQDLTPAISLPKLGMGLQGEVKRLRRQIAFAEADQETMIAQIQQLEAEILRWDASADEALLAKQDAHTRYAIEQMEMTKQRLHMARAHLQDHQQALYELMKQADELEHLSNSPQTDPTESSPATDSALSLSESIRQARESVQAEAGTPDEAIRIKLETDIATTIDESTVEQDLSARRSRLAKPD